MDARRTWALLRFLFTTLFLFAVWLLFTSDLTRFSLLFGFFGSILISYLTYDVFLPPHQASLRFFFPKIVGLVKFLALLVFLLYKSSFQVMLAVLSKNTNPRIVHFRTHLHSDLARTILANSITLTPGTLTVDLNDDHLTVHWLFCTTTHTKAAGDAIKKELEKSLGGTWI